MTYKRLVQEDMDIDRRVILQKYRITGTTPLLLSNGRMANPTDPMVAKLKAQTSIKGKTEAVHEEIAKIEWEGRLYLNKHRQLTMPGHNIEASIRDAARWESKGKIVSPSLYVPSLPAPFLEIERRTGVTLEELDPVRDEYWLQVMAKIKRDRILRTRPMFPEWAVDFELQYRPRLIDESKIYYWLIIAGMQCGLGDWRPRYGQYEVERIGKPVEMISVNGTACSVKAV
ncbi:MAG TPA: hypothetical protein VM537_29865 [Anaerolineae bacterium]|nr:hypothetical protein [Anaerolineae bacterium]